MHTHHPKDLWTANRLTTPSGVQTVRLSTYGCLVWKHHVFVVEEPFPGFPKPLVKFPGGGVAPQEDLRQALIREWQEELNVRIRVEELVYVNPFPVRSAVYPAARVLAFYWRVTIPDPTALTGKGLWLPLCPLETEQFALLTDRMAFLHLLPKTFLDVKNEKQENTFDRFVSGNYPKLSTERD